MNCNIITNVTLLITFLFTFIPARAIADGWDISSQQDKMKNYVIADVGEVSKVELPSNTTIENDVYQINDRCFLLSDNMGYWGYGSKAALLLMNAQKDT